MRGAPKPLHELPLPTERGSCLGHRDEATLDVEPLAQQQQQQQRPLGWHCDALARSFLNTCAEEEISHHRPTGETFLPSAPPPRGPSRRAHGIQGPYRPDSAKLSISYSCRPSPGRGWRTLLSRSIPGETAASVRCARILRRAVSRAPRDGGCVALGRGGQRSLARMLCLASASSASRCAPGARAASPQPGHRSPGAATTLSRLRSTRATVAAISDASR